MTEDIRESLFELVKEGKLAIILSIEGGVVKDSYINGNQVIVRCPHCLKIVNKGKKNPSPNERPEQSKK